MKKTLILTVCFMFMIVGVALAGVGPIKHEAELATEISYVTYEEPDVMEEEGLMCGISGIYAYNNNFMFKAESKISWGAQDYSSTSTGSVDNIDNLMFEVRGLVGRSFDAFSQTSITPYIGFGYRYLNDDSSGMTTSTGHVGYERESNYYYSPIGIETLTELDNGWLLGFMVEYDIFWKGKQKSHLSDANLGFADLENDQNDGYGIRGSVKFLKKRENTDLLIEPFIKYWDIDKSEEVNVTYSGIIIGRGYEPKNNSTEIGIKVAIRF
ncbi:MAG TPA: hypothetical protein ENH41_00420 [Candidatus Omnitrophica bacterium]|nr:hypothetical protein [Candidatus Omnitrophota bacterium]